MIKILVAGASGGLGNEVLKELKKRKYFVRAIVTGEEEAKKVKKDCNEVVTGDASDEATAGDASENIDIVFSAIGKSLSLFSENDSSFKEIDYETNKNLINISKAKGVKRFVYISVYGSDVYGDFELAKQHREVEKELSASGLSYTIIRPVAIFTGLLDILRMAKLGTVVTVGSGDNQVNPIHEKDLAKVCADNIESGPTIIEAGGPKIYTRNEIAELAGSINGDSNHIHIPKFVVDGSLPILNVFNENFFHKLEFFNNVLTHDVVAPSYGRRSLRKYFEEMKDKV